MLLRGFAIRDITVFESLLCNPGESKLKSLLESMCKIEKTEELQTPLPCCDSFFAGSRRRPTNPKPENPKPMVRCPYGAATGGSHVTVACEEVVGSRM